MSYAQRNPFIPGQLKHVVTTAYLGVTAQAQKHLQQSNNADAFCVTLIPASLHLWLDAIELPRLCTAQHPDLPPISLLCSKISMFILVM